jgi:glycosyltransferase involved in cell wall biosynthesis
MQATPLISVIIPTYNRVKLIMKAIRSVWDQSYPSVELIVVDDGSTDGTRELLEFLPGITYYYTPNGGQAAARNLGFQYAKGEFIATLDSDDTWEKNFLSNCFSCIEQHQLDFVFANWIQTNKKGKPFDFLSRDPFIKPYLNKTERWKDWILLDQQDLKKLFLVSCPSPSSSVLMRRSSIVKGWNNTLRIGEDWSLYLDMIFLREGIKAGFTLEPLWVKHAHENNIYDGRLRSEILEIIVKDDLEIINMYQAHLTPDELKILNRKYVCSLTELSKHMLVRRRDFKRCWQLFNKSLKADLTYTFRVIPHLFLNALRNRGLSRKPGSQDEATY